MPRKTFCNPINQEYFPKLKITTASSKFLNYQNSTYSAYHVCLEKQSAMQLINKIHTNSQFHRFKQEVSITNTHTHTAHHAILGKQSAIHMMKNISTRAKCQLPQAGLSITNKIRQCTPCVPRRTFCNPIDQQYLHTLKISI